MVVLVYCNMKRNELKNSKLSKGFEFGQFWWIRRMKSRDIAERYLCSVFALENVKEKYLNSFWRYMLSKALFSNIS